MMVQIIWSSCVFSILKLPSNTLTQPYTYTLDNTVLIILKLVNGLYQSLIEKLFLVIHSL